MPVAADLHCRFNPANVRTNANILRAWRRRAKLSRQAMAARVDDLDPMTIYNAERGKNISDRKMLKMLEALGKTIDDLEREARENGTAIIVESDDGSSTPLAEALVREAESAAISSGKSLAEWVTLAISAYLRKPPTEPAFS